MKPAFPLYSINTLDNVPSSPKELTADHFAHYLATHSNLHFPHKHSFFHFVYFSKGSGQQAIDFVSFPVKPGDIYFMIPGQVHSWAFKSKPDGYIVNFSEEYLTKLVADPRYLDQFSFFSGAAQQQVISVPAKERSYIESLLERIVQESQSAHQRKDDFIRASLVQLFILVERLATKKENSEEGNYNSLLLRNFQQLIEKFYKSKKLTRDYAALLFITPNHLNALCNAVTGRPAGELIRERVLLEAKRLLINAGMSVSEIAAELDFSDSSYFTKFFRKYEGITPEAFRKQFIKKR